MARKIKRTGVCPYCGQIKSLNREHVFPKTLFKRLDEDMIVIDACYACNREKSLGDRDLRNYVNLHIEGSRHPDAEYHILKMMDHEATRNWLKSEMDASIDIDLLSKQGIILGQGFGINFNRDRALASLRYSIRGLYVLQTGVVLAPNMPVSVLEIDFRVALPFMKRILRFNHDDLVVKGNDVVSYAAFSQIGDQGPESSAYLILINGGVCFLGGTGSVAEWITRFEEMRARESIDMPTLDGRGSLQLVPDEHGGYRIPPQ